MLLLVENVVWKKNIRNNKTDIKKNEKKWKKNEKNEKEDLFFKVRDKSTGKRLSTREKSPPTSSCAFAEHISGQGFFRWVTSLPVTSLPVMRNGPNPLDPPQIRLELYPYTTLVSSAVDRKFKPGSVQTKYYKIDICCFSGTYAALRSKSNDWLNRNQNNVSEWKRHVYLRTVALVR